VKFSEAVTSTPNSILPLISGPAQRFDRTAILELEPAEWTVEERELDPLPTVGNGARSNRGDDDATRRHANRRFWLAHRQLKIGAAGAE
jgi:hypothetical protein